MPPTSSPQHNTKHINVIALGLCIFKHKFVRSVLSQSEGPVCLLRDNLCDSIKIVQCNNICLACTINAPQVRERSQKSVAMSSTRHRSSLSASTPDSLSDNESSMGVVGGRYTPRKPSYTPIRTGLTPGGSRNGSKPSSRPASRTGSKPPSRHGSNLSLNSQGNSTLIYYNAK